jgi:hypothetical protein
VHYLEGLPNGVKVAIVALVLIAFLAVVLYLQFRSPRRRR